MNKAIDRVKNYRLHIIDKFTTLCRTQDTPIKTLEHIVMVNYFQWIRLSTSFVRADKLCLFEHLYWNTVRMFFHVYFICINFIKTEIEHLWSTWIFMYVSCMYHELIHIDTYMKPCSNPWKIHEISCIIFWQI